MSPAALPSSRRSCLVEAVAGVALASALAGCADPSPCAGPSAGGACRALRITGLADGGELGFRFGEPLDLDGDGAVDLAAGSRRAGDEDTGEAVAWSGSGELMTTVRGRDRDGLFGNVTLAVPDLDGDGRADLVVSAPNASKQDDYDGLVEAYDVDGQLLWRAPGRVADGLGWHLARAGDRDGDGVEDLWAGAPSNPVAAHVYLLSGATGAVLDTVASPFANDGFGFYLSAVDDLDGDGVADLAVGAPTAMIDGAPRGAVVLVSGATRRVLRELHGETAGSGFGLAVAPCDDLDGDGVPEVAVGAPGDADPITLAHGDVQIFSGATGARLRRLTSPDGDDFYGRSLARLDDLDGDGVRELAIGAPWWHANDGRLEVRSARTFALLADVRGTDAGWLGWHVARADGGLVVSSLHLDADRGALDLYRLR